MTPKNYPIYQYYLIVKNKSSHYLFLLDSVEAETQAKVSVVACRWELTGIIQYIQ